MAAKVHNVLEFTLHTLATNELDSTKLCTMLCIVYNVHTIAASESERKKERSLAETIELHSTATTNRDKLLNS